MERKTSLVTSPTQSALAYRGEVTVELVKGDKVYQVIRQHNEGTAELFRYLANALAGNVNTTNMPRYLHTFNAENPETDQGDNLYGTNRSTCALNVPFSNVEVRYDSTLDGYSTEYTFMIPFSQIWGTTNVLALYNTIAYGNAITPLAFIRLNEDQWIRASSSNTANVVVRWVMTVYNAQVAE
jgi:hypothetical protein